MKTKNIIIYISILVAGILIGSLLFGGNASNKNDSESAMHEEHEHVEEGPSWYTCSMHPQIQQQEPGDCPLCAMDLIPMSENSSINDPGIIQMTEDAVKLAQIQTSEVSYTFPQKTLYLQGKIEMDERRNSSQTSHFPGRIEKLYVSFEGEMVQKGQKLASIYSPELVTAQQEYLEALKSKDQYPNLVEAAEKKLRFWKLSKKQIQSIGKQNSIIENFDVYADQSGLVMKKKVNQGDYVKKGQSLFQISDMNKLWVIFDAFEKDLPFISEGDLVEFSVGALPGERFAANITFVDPMMDSKKRVATVRAEIDNTSGKLKPGMFANGLMVASLKESPQVITVPRSSVMWTGKRSVVYVKYEYSDEPAFELRDVTLGETLGNSYIITSGLEVGEKVVTHGTFTVDASAQLNAKYSMMNPDPETQNKMEDISTQIPGEFRSAFDLFLNHYLIMKDHLVVDDSLKVQHSAIKMLEAFSDINTQLLPDEGRISFEQFMKIVIENTEIIAENNSLINQRDVFKPLSAHLIELVKSLGSENTTIFVQYCPMADNDTGGHWLSTEEEIMNPYFGDLMLHCGEVESIIK